MNLHSLLLGAAAALALAHGAASAQATFGGSNVVPAQPGQAPVAAPEAPPPPPPEPVAPTYPRTQTEPWWGLLRAGGHVLLAIHGATDPAKPDDRFGITLGNCRTQRNLTDAGREDARRLAAVLKQRGVAIDRVVAGETCRARETAQLAFGELSRKPVETWDRLNNLPSMPNSVGLQSLLPMYTAEIRLFATGFSGPGNLVLVMHPYNAEPLLKGTLGAGLTEGEFAILKLVSPGRYEVVGRIQRAAW